MLLTWPRVSCAVSSADCGTGKENVQITAVPRAVRGRSGHPGGLKTRGGGKAVDEIGFAGSLGAFEPGAADELCAGHDCLAGEPAQEVGGACRQKSIAG